MPKTTRSVSTARLRDDERQFGPGRRRRVQERQVLERLHYADDRLRDGRFSACPVIDDGITGLTFVKAAVESNAKDGSWVECRKLI